MKLMEGPCEMSVGVEMNGNPRVILCGKPGIERPELRPHALVAPIACDECTAAWKGHHAPGSV